MADARLIEVCDGVRDVIDAGWDSAEPDEAVRDYVTEATLATLTGRKVYVLPAGFTPTIDRPTRTEVTNEYRVSVRVMEKYGEATKPQTDVSLKTWLDERVRWVELVLVPLLDKDDRADLLLSSLWAETIDVPNLPDPDLILGAGVFWAEIEVAYRETVVG